MQLPQPPRTSHTLAGVLSRIQRGERGTDPGLARDLDRAFGKHEQALERFCRSELRGFPDECVQEIAQDVLLEAWSKLPEYRAEGPFRAFLWGIASLKCANARRKRRDTLSDDGLMDPASEAGSTLGRLEDAERGQLIEEAAANVLDREEQEIVHLRWVLDYPYEDVAAQLGLAPADVVRVTLQRCKRRLAVEVARLMVARGLGASFLRPGQG